MKCGDINGNIFNLETQQALGNLKGLKRAAGDESL